MLSPLCYQIRFCPKIIIKFLRIPSTLDSCNLRVVNSRLSFLLINIMYFPASVDTLSPLDVATLDREWESNSHIYSSVL